MSSSTNNFTETLFKNSRPETSVNSYLNGAVKDSRERLLTRNSKKNSMKKSTALFHCNPPIPRTQTPNRGKAAEKTSIISVSTDFSSDIGSKESSFRSCHTPRRLLYPPHKPNKTMESAR